MSKRIIFIILVPLIIVICLLVYLHLKFNWDGFFINLITEIIGIMLTVFFVDLLIKNNNNKKWRESHSYISNRLLLRINMIISSINYSFGNNRMFELEKNETIESVNKQIIAYAKELLIANLKNTIGNIELNTYEKLINDLQYANEQLERHIMLFGEKIAPEVYAMILDILINIRNTYSDSVVYSFEIKEKGRKNFMSEYYVLNYNGNEVFNNKGFDNFKDRLINQIENIINCTIKLSESLQK